LPPEMLRVAMPHLVVWGEDDRALLPSCLAGLEDFAPRLTLRTMPGCGHWLLHEQPAAVAREIRSFLAA
jgi:epoxide hydrolase 4